jgi:hypothetical protein
MINGIIKETILHSSPRAIAYWKRNQLQASGNYNLGLLLVKKLK